MITPKPMECDNVQAKSTTTTWNWWQGNCYDGHTKDKTDDPEEEQEEKEHDISYVGKGKGKGKGKGEC